MNFNLNCYIKLKVYCDKYKSKGVIYIFNFKDTIQKKKDYN